MILPAAFDFFDIEQSITRVPIYAAEGIKAVQQIGFEKRPDC